MGQTTTDTSIVQCLNCGFESPAGKRWERVTHPPLGELTQCPECGSTNVHSVS
ncbi:MAG: hypothetical protein ACQETB_08095 [Halobacteriota archaeon]